MPSLEVQESVNYPGHTEFTQVWYSPSKSHLCVNQSPRLQVETMMCFFTEEFGKGSEMPFPWLWYLMRQKLYDSLSCDKIIVYATPF